MICRLWNIYQDYRVKKIVSGDLFSAWSRVKQVWGKARIIYRGPVGFSAKLHFEFKLLEEFITTYPNCEQLLIEATTDTNPYVCGYALVALEFLGSRYLQNLPNSLLERSEIIVWKLASRKGIVSLGQFATYHTLN